MKQNKLEYGRIKKLYGPHRRMITEIPIIRNKKAHHKRIGVQTLKPTEKKTASNVMKN